MIGHSLFRAIPINRGGCLLDSFETALNYIRTSTTETGLRMRAERITAECQEGVKINKRPIEHLNWCPAKTLPKWNYEIRCQTNLDPSRTSFPDPAADPLPTWPRPSP